MHLFFQHYNSVLHVVHEEAFVTDKENGGTRFYSGFLHMCILTMGYRFADKSRPDIQRIALPDRDSTIHREAKYMLDLELERPGGIPSVGALLILGDSEVGVGRDNVGWMYAGMAIRLAYDVGLHLDNRQSGMSQLEVDIRNMTLWACVIYDRYWSLFLGRPTAMKSSDLETYYLAQRFERLGSCRPAGLEGSLITRIYEALLDLMDIGGQIVELPEHREKVSNTSQVPDHSSYLRMMAIDRQLRSWAGRLPEDLRYSKANSSTVPFAFYMLHQQYHAVLILLHRPFARYGNLNTQDGKMTGTLDSHFSNTSIAICTKSAVAIAYIFWQHRKRFDGRLMFSGAMQHAGTAAMALIAALAYTSSAAERNMNMRCLDILHAALQDMSHMLQPAEKMATVLGAAMIALRPGQVSGPPSSTSSHTDDAVLAEMVDQGATHPMVQSKKYPEKLSTSTPTVSNHRREIGLQSIEASQSYYQLYNTPDTISRHASVPGWPAFQNSTEFLPMNPSFTADPGPIGRSQIHDLQHSYPRSYSVSDPAISGAGLDIQYADTNGGVDFRTVPSETDGARW
nr:putative transcriptional regulatory protein [Quercus suber]